MCSKNMYNRTPLSHSSNKYVQKPHPSQIPLPSSSKIPCIIRCLKAEGVTCDANNSGLNLGRSKLGIAIRKSIKGSSKSSIGRSTKVIINTDSITSIRAIQRLAGSRPCSALNKDLSSITCVDTIGNVQEVAVKDVAGTKAEGWGTGVDVAPVVVIVGDAQVTGILGTVAVRVADERSLPVVVDVRVGDCDEVCGVGEVQEAIVVIFVVVSVR